MGLESLIIIIDPSLKSSSGHFLTYDKSIATELTTRGQDCVVLASKSASPSLDRELQIVPCFRYQLEDNSLPPRALTSAFIEDLIAGVANIPGAEEALFFLHTCTPPQIEAVANFVADRRYARTKMIILLRYSITINQDSPDLDNVERYKRALAEIENLGVEDRVVLTTDSDLLGEEYALITDQKISTLPIPHVTQVEICDAIAPTITYLGNARSSKGFQYLPFLMTQLAPELRQGKWRAELQANVMFARDHESVAALATLRTQPVTLFEYELSIDHYRELLGRASLIVIPYILLWYHAQTSGVFAEAIGAGKPVVVPRGTWMAHELGEHKAGILFNPGDRIDFARATRTALERLPDLTEGAKAFQLEWRKRHSPPAFVDALIALGAQ